MSDRSDEVTTSRDSSDPPSTEDLLEETDRLLSGTDSSPGSTSSSEPGSAPSSGPGSNAGATDDLESGPSTDPLAELEAETAAGTAESEDAESSGSSRLSVLPGLPSLSGAPSLAVDRYFSPKAFFSLILLFGAGVFAGGMALPVAGRALGLLAVAFVLGLVTSKRRYLEVTTAGASVGALAALLNHVILAVAGSGTSIVAVGAGLGLVACLVGYYFGRDLKSGLTRDVE